MQYFMRVTNIGTGQFWYQCSNTCIASHSWNCCAIMCDNEHIIEGKQSHLLWRSHDCHTHYSPHPTSSSPSLQSTSPSHIHPVGTHKLEAGQKDSLSGLHRMSACTERQANEISTALVTLVLSHRFLHTKTAIYRSSPQT